jgi:hypothetical protein
MNALRVSFLGVAGLLVGACSSSSGGGFSDSGASTGSDTSSGTQVGSTSGTTGSITGTSSGTGGVGSTGFGTDTSSGSITGTGSGSTSGSGTGAGSGTGTGETTGSGTGTGTGGTTGSGTGTGTGGTTGSGTGTGASTGSGTGTGTSGSTGSATRTGSGTISASGLPSPTTTGVAKPSGTAGGLKVLPWAGFTGAVSFTLDDANQCQISDYSTLEGLGVHFTFFLIGMKISTNQSGWAQALKDGHEAANHTWDHMTISQSNVDQGASTIQSSLGVRPYSFAAPNGTNGSGGYEPFAEKAHLMDRGVEDGLYMPDNSSGLDQYNSPGFIPAQDEPASMMETEISSARTAGAWRVFTVHGFEGSESSGVYQPLNLSDFVSTVQYATGLGDMWVDSFGTVGAYWLGKTAFDKTTPTTSGTSQTWKWTLPANYPPGKYLRVTVTGGTLTQNGTTLQWNTHGYYEISLDAGSLTLSP